MPVLPRRTPVQRRERRGELSALGGNVGGTPNKSRSMCWQPPTQLPVSVPAAALLIQLQLVVWESSGRQTKCLGPCTSTHVGDQMKLLAVAWPTLAVVTIWKVNQWLADLCNFFFLPFK